MKVRVISALAALAVLIPVVVVGGKVFTGMFLILGIMALFELANMKKIEYFNLVGVIATIAVALMILPSNYQSALIPGLKFTYLFYICCMLLLVLTVYEYKTFNIEEAALLIFGALYIGYGFRYLIELRQISLDLVIFQFAIIFATDSGAYIVGRRFGKHKLAPQLSPNKTIEGSLGGVASAVVIAVLYNYFFDPHLGGSEHYILLAMALSVLGQLGDLVESAFKRHFGVKDSGKFLPGHGGVLDRFDSTLFTSFLLMTWFNWLK